MDAEVKRSRGRPKKGEELPVTPNVIIDSRTPSKKKELVTEPLEVITDTIEDLPVDVIQVRRANPTYTIETRDPHGYSYIKGPNLPPRLQGAYTTYIVAKQELDNWLKENK